MKLSPCPVCKVIFFKVPETSKELITCSCGAKFYVLHDDDNVIEYSQILGEKYSNAVPIYACPTLPFEEE